MKVRPAAGSALLEETMQRVVKVSSKAELMDLLRRDYWFWSPTEENVMMSYYGYDARIGWDTHLVTVAGNAALFTDGLFPESSG